MAIKKRPQSPRQKMINLMYVVLMAMLAMNISNEVLDGFSIVEESLKRSTDNSTKQNDAIYSDFEEQMKVVDATLADLGCSDKPEIIIFNKIDAYTWVVKESDDLTPATRENVSLDELMRTWMAKLGDDCIFISAREKTNLEELRSLLYSRIKQLHVQKYPYNDFLYPDIETT